MSHFLAATIIKSEKNQTLRNKDFWRCMYFDEVQCFSAEFVMMLQTHPLAMEKESFAYVVMGLKNLHIHTNSNNHNNDQLYL